MDLNGWMDGFVVGWMAAWMHGCMDGEISEIYIPLHVTILAPFFAIDTIKSIKIIHIWCVCLWVSGWVDGWMDGRMNGWTGDLINCMGQPITHPSIHKKLHIKIDHINSYHYATNPHRQSVLHPNNQPANHSTISTDIRLTIAPLSSILPLRR